MAFTFPLPITQFFNLLPTLTPLLCVSHLPHYLALRSAMSAEHHAFVDPALGDHGIVNG